MNKFSEWEVWRISANCGKKVSPLAAIRVLLGLIMACVAASTAHCQLTRDQKVRADKASFEADGFWIYNDFAQAVLAAEENHQPIIAVLRCIPCEECVKLDEELMADDAELQTLLQQFVRVRLVSTNGLDLSLFQFDDDQSFAIFFLNSDGTIYGRYGTRSHRTQWDDDVSVDGLKRAIARALEFHKGHPANRDAFVNKRGPAPAVPVPEKFPSLQRYAATLDYGEKLVPSCIHCHQVADARKEWELSTTGGLTDKELFPFPHPKSLGLILDPNECAQVLKVEPKSTAASAGFREGDIIESLNGQSLLSIADVQWVLHQANPEGHSLLAKVRRGRETIDLTCVLEAGWREQSDISWRASTWELRRIALGGMQLKSIDRASGDDPEGAPVLSVVHVGQYSPHDVAKQAGFLAGDEIVSVDGRTEFLRETDLIAYLLRQKSPGDDIAFRVRRGESILDLTVKRQ